MADDEEVKIVFAPGALEELEANMTPEEVQKFLDDLKASVEDGTFFEESQDTDLEELEEQDPELYAKIVGAMDSLESPEERKKKLN